MLNYICSVFSGIFDTESASVVSVGNFFLCLGVSLLIGLFLSAVYTFRSKYTRSFLVALGLLPAVVCVVIMAVNGNIGVGVAVAGAFTLVRFRSAPGSAKEITALFVAMAVGILTGTGYLAYAALFGVLIGIILIFCQLIRFPERKSKRAERTLRVTIPEDLDYSDLFEDIFAEFTTECKVVSVKTTNMGSLFKITYLITEKDIAKEKQMIDALRVRNGNLEISVSEQEKNEEL